jgi:hypothetical protein
MLLGFYAQEQEAGTPEERDRFSQDVFDRFNHHIVEAAAKAGIELSLEARSIVAVLATMAPGGAPKTKAGQAMKAYIEYRGV